MFQSMYWLLYNKYNIKISLFSHIINYRSYSPSIPREMTVTKISENIQNFEINETLHCIELYLLGYNAVQYAESQPTFRRNILPVWKQVALSLLATCFHVGFLLVLFFDPEDGGDMFLRNAGWLSTDYMALYPRR
jgi:hypothetical protein